MQAIKCLICSTQKDEAFMYAKDANNVFPDKFSLVRCKECGFVYLSPRKEDAQQYLYTDAYYVNAKGALRYLVRILDIIFQAIRAHRIARFKDRGIILDVGCGEGKFLEQMRRLGWQCYGVEPSMSACKVTEESLKPKILNRILTECGFFDSQFDVVTFWHSLEHIADPILDLATVNRILKDDGLLFLALPNIDSFEFKLAQSRWFHLDAPRHLYHFTPKTISALLEKSGFEVKKISHHAFIYNAFSFSQSLINLIDINTDSFYRFLKHGRLNAGQHYTLSELYSIALGILLNAVLFIPSIFFAYIASIAGKSATIYVYAKKKQGDKK